MFNKIGFVNDILSWPFWVPLSRLNFCAYLIHVEFIQYYFLTQEQPPFLQEVNLVNTKKNLMLKFKEINIIFELFIGLHVHRPRVYILLWLLFSKLAL